MTGVLQESAADDHCAQVGFDDQRLTHLFHDDHVLDRTAAQAAQLLGERRA